MSPRVPHEFVSVPEGLVAEVTNVPLVVAFVNAKMFGEVLAFGERLVTHGAGVRTIQVALRALWIPAVCIITVARCHVDCLRRTQRNGSDHCSVVYVWRVHTFLFRNTENQFKRRPVNYPTGATLPASKTIRDSAARRRPRLLRSKIQFTRSNLFSLPVVGF